MYRDELAEKARHGDRDAFEALVRAGSGRLYAVAYATTEDAAVAADAPVHVTWEGAPDYFFAVDVPEEVFPWGERALDGVHVSIEASDPRVSGEQIIVGASDYPVIEADGGRGTSFVRIENADGAWQGPIIEVDMPDNLVIRYGWLMGEGDYEGLSYFTSYHDDTASDVRNGQGMIWPGEPPPVPDAALLDADPLD